MLCVGCITKTLFHSSFPVASSSLTKTPINFCFYFFATIEERNTKMFFSVSILIRKSFVQKSWLLSSSSHSFVIVLLLRNIKTNIFLPLCAPIPGSWNDLNIQIILIIFRFCFKSAFPVLISIKAFFVVAPIIMLKLKIRNICRCCSVGVVAFVVVCGWSIAIVSVSILKPEREREFACYYHHHHSH